MSNDAKLPKYAWFFSQGTTLNQRRELGVFGKYMLILSVGMVITGSQVSLSLAT